MNIPDEIKEQIYCLLSEGKHIQAAALVVLEFEHEPDFQTYMMAMNCKIENIIDTILEVITPEIVDTVALVFAEFGRTFAAINETGE